MRRPLTLLALSTLLAAPLLAQDAPAPRKRSVIFFIGDGMGVSQVTLGRLAAQELDQPYQLDRFKVTGLADTRSANSVVTDSAAAATALATGLRTDNWKVGMTPDEAWHQTVLELAHVHGYRTGVVTTTRLTHATPAGFTAHVKHRNLEREIAAQQVRGMVERGFPHVLLGGGKRYLTDELLNTVREVGYAVVTEPGELMAAEGERLVGVISTSHVPWRIDRVEGMPTLAQLTEKAVTTLAQGAAPFAVMVEGGRIDHAGHSHDAASMVHEQLDLDAAVGWALDYAEAHPEALVVVTADHATGALGISERSEVAALLASKASSESLLEGTKELTAALKRLVPELLEADADTRALKLRELRAGDLLKGFEDRVAKAYDLALTDEELLEVFGDGDPYWQEMALGHVLSQRRGCFFYPLHEAHTQLTGTHGHDGGAVPVFAFGPGAAAFGGLYENRQIPLKIAEVLGLPKPGATVEAGAQLQPAGQK